MPHFMVIDNGGYFAYRIHFIFPPPPPYRFPLLKNALDNPGKDAPLVFCKTVAYPLIGKYRFLPDKSSNYRYTIILRHPLRVFKSWRKGMYDLVTQIAALSTGSTKSWEEFHFMHDVPDKYKVEDRHFKGLYDQWQYVKENLDPNPLIIDSDELLSDPKGMLTKFCAELDIPYSDDLIRWDGDPKGIDGWWQPYNKLYDFQFGLILCENAMYAKGFKKPSKLPVLEEMSEDVKESYEMIKPYYEEMYEARLKPWGYAYEINQDIHCYSHEKFALVRYIITIRFPTNT